MITPEPPAGSEHYREGWRHGYEQAAIDRERSTDAVRLGPATGQAREKAVYEAASRAFREYTGTREGEPMWNLNMESTWQIIAPAVVAALDSLAVPDTGQARADHLAAGIRRFAHDCKLLLGSGGLDNRVARSIAQQERNLRALLAEPSGDTAQTPDVADLAYARSEVDKWLASTDPYCILPTRTEHIPALLARLDELEGTR